MAIGKVAGIVGVESFTSREELKLLTSLWRYIVSSITILMLMTCWSSTVQSGSILEDLKARTDQGEVSAMLQLAEIYRYGPISQLADGAIVERNIGLSIEMYKLVLKNSSKGGPTIETFAHYALGAIYYDGENLQGDTDLISPDFEKHDIRQAMEHLIRVPDNPEWRDIYSDANYKLGMIFLKECDFYKLSICPAAEASKAPFRDLKRAAHYFKKAAEYRNPEAKYMLASMYVRGIGVIENFDKAITLFEELANDGRNDVFYPLADVNERSGRLVLAHMWYNLAHMGTELERLSSLLSPEERLQAQQLAADWLEKHRQE